MWQRQSGLRPKRPAEAKIRALARGMMGELAVGRAGTGERRTNEGLRLLRGPAECLSAWPVWVSVAARRRDPFACAPVSCGERCVRVRRTVGFNNLYYSLRLPECNRCASLDCALSILHITLHFLGPFHAPLTRSDAHDSRPFLQCSPDLHLSHHARAWLTTNTTTVTATARAMIPTTRGLATGTVPRGTLRIHLLSTKG